MLKLDNVKEKLDTVSSCFCLAKWTTVTLHLESGTTHSCHHPKVHKIPLSELENNPAALHNTEFKIKQRKKMLDGARPSECDYCWNIEDLKTGEISDRIWKSSSDHSLPEFDNVLKTPLSAKFKPRYVEVSFSNACQFKCSYCSADYSSTWADELEKFGNYPTRSGMKTFTAIKEEENPYVQAFWKWWPDLKIGLHTFRITGGEPLLSPSTFRVMENLIAYPEPELNLAVNTNLGAPPVLVEKFTRLAGELLSQKAIKTFEVYTSIDAYAARAEYIRNGLKHETFWQNVDKLLASHPTLKITIMCTFNALSLTSYIDLLKKIMEVNLAHRNEDRKLPVYLDIAYLRHPTYQAVKVLPDSYIAEAEKIHQFLDDNQWQKTANHVGFHEDQLIKMGRILEWMRQPLPEAEKKKRQKEFYEFFSEHDRRRNTDFLKTFPEMEDFWKQCRDL